MQYTSDIGFSDTVKTIQTRKGSRDMYAKMEAGRGFRTDITPELAAELTRTRSFFLGTSNSAGQPYIQHRGGPPGFIQVIDHNTFGFADFKGNRQYISQGNLEDNNQAFVFLIDYATQSRIKIWGYATVIEDDEELLARFMPPADTYRARAEQLIVFRVTAWDPNCRQHIPPRIDQEEVDAMLATRDQRIAELEAQLERLQIAEAD